MDERQRQQLLDKIKRTSGTLGKSIPEKITIQGTEIDLNAFIFECNRLDTIPEDKQDRIEEVEKQLKRERLERKHQIAEDDISYEKGKELVESIRGIDRAINALEGLDSPSISEEICQEKIENARELMTLIRQQP
ncbi:MULTISPECIES: DUF5788 family protein [unclassified Natrinema]|uniref:DUF5788 family protein n=1 Tax=unclassified Natrinema TaxID=2622230 RepID=UPI00026D47D4|nr:MULTISPECIES: DUF5788 family protein [unclassified Natrinema]AFO59123.1 hypothetical protein NJ7G_3907 [Natrinema sp. J7-2]